MSSRLCQEVWALRTHRPGPDGQPSWAAQDGARCDVELAAVAGARHRRPVQLAVGERAPSMSAGVVVRMTDPYEHALSFDPNLVLVVLGG
jgi:hypothetical protein